MTAKKSTVPGRKSAASSRGKSPARNTKGNSGKAQTARASAGRNRLPDVIGVLIIAMGLLAMYFLYADSSDASTLGSAIKTAIKGVSGALAMVVPIVIIFMGFLIVFSGMGKLRPWRVMLAGAVVLLFFGIWHLFAADAIGALIPAEYLSFIDASFREGCTLSRGSGSLGGIMSWHVYHYLGVWAGVIVLSALLLICVMLLSRVSVREVGEKVSTGISTGLAEYRNQREVVGRRKAELRAQKLEEQVQREERLRIEREERAQAIEEERRRRDEAERRFAELNQVRAQNDEERARNSRTSAQVLAPEDTRRPQEPLTPQYDDGDPVDVPEFLTGGRRKSGGKRPSNGSRPMAERRPPDMEADEYGDTYDAPPKKKRSLYIEDIHVENAKYKHRGDQEAYRRDMEARLTTENVDLPPFLDKRKKPGSIYDVNELRVNDGAPASEPSVDAETATPSGAQSDPFGGVRFDGYYDSVDSTYDYPDDYLPPLADAEDMDGDAVEPESELAAQVTQAIKQSAQPDMTVPRASKLTAAKPSLEPRKDDWHAPATPDSAYPTGIAIDENGMPYETYVAEQEPAVAPVFNVAVDVADDPATDDEPASDEIEYTVTDTDYDATTDDDELPFVPDVPPAKPPRTSGMPEHIRTNRPVDVGVDHVEIPKLEPVPSKITKDSLLKVTSATAGQPVSPAQAAPATDRSPAPESRTTAALRRKAQIDLQPEPEEPKPYVFPPLDLLSPSQPGKLSSAEQRELDMGKARKLEETLSDFGITAKVIGISRGPAITRFELSPAPGVRVSKIAGLSDDIALNLCATAVRIEAPIPGKAAVGIELPNDQVDVVALHDVLASDEAAKSKAKLAVALGKDNAGRFIMADVARMPHVLIAGATGSGKSVCINTIIMSILFRTTPEQVRLILVDPKVVELSVYNGVPHLLTPVVTDPKKAASALNWAVLEMTERYQRFAERGVRDIKGYNESVGEGEKPLPSIVIIIDELSDLMMVAAGDVEDSICRLAQLARAAGIHLVVATQRPSVNVITGVIKANIPSRIAFMTSSQVDSRTIIDGSGAEKLLGRGDMLYVPQGVNKPLRVQGAFVSDEEVNLVTSYIKSQCEAEYNSEIAKHMDSNDGGDDDDDSISENGYDEYTPQVAELAIEAGQISISMVQRRMRIGYARAGRIVDEMTKLGIVSPAEGAKPRNVLITRDDLKRFFP